MFLKVSPIKGARRFNVKERLSPRFVGPCDISKKINPTAYCLALPLEMQHVHNVLYSSQLHNCVRCPTHAIVYEPLEVEGGGLTYGEKPREASRLKSKTIAQQAIHFVKVTQEQSWSV